MARIVGLAGEVPEQIGVITDQDMRALRMAETVIAYHGESYSRAGCDDRTGVLIAKWHERITQQEVEYTIKLPSSVRNYGGGDPYGTKYSACGYSVDVQSDYGAHSAAVAFLAMVKAGDTVALLWTRSTNTGRDCEGTPYDGLMHDRVALRIERKRKELSFPLNDRISFDPSTRMIRAIT